MTFEEDFPSLKGHMADYDDENECFRAGVYFGNLTGTVVHTNVIWECCLDKAKVKEVINTFKFKKEDMPPIEELYKILDEKGWPRFLADNLIKVWIPEIQNVYARLLKKELGLK